MKDLYRHILSLSLVLQAMAIIGQDGITPKRLSITFDQFVGSNAFVDDSIDNMKVGTFIREYHNWNWDEGDIWEHGGNRNYKGYPNNTMKFAPSEAGGGEWNFDEFYLQCKEAGIAVYPVLMGAVKWLNDSLNFNLHHKPVDQTGAVTTDPDSYQAKAHYMFQFAARYGSTKVPDSLLTLAPSQPRNSGLCLIDYLEDWNEQDANWHGPGAYFSPEEYAAMSSANYDGHCNTMNQGTGTFGIKNADPNMKFVMGGIWELNLQYIKDMERWYKKNRNDGKFVPDVINVHDYAWGSDSTKRTLSPEEENWRGQLEEITRWRDENYPEKEVWINEFGYDTHEGSKLSVPSIPGFNKYEVQGVWLVRAYLAFSAAGVDRACMYMLRNVDENNSEQFSNCGFTFSKKLDYHRKVSWYYVHTLKETLAGMRFDGDKISQHPDVLIYKFKSVDAKNGAYVVWCPTSEGITVENFQLNFDSSTAVAVLIKLINNSKEGCSEKLKISGNSVTINVGEKPVFILVNNI